MVLRREHRRRLAAARAARAAGDLETARRVLEPIAHECRRAARELGGLALLLGDHEAADALLRDPAERALLHYRTGRYELAHGLRVRGELPILQLMRGFGAKPYRIEGDAAELPFVQTERWDLPTVEIEVDGRAVEAWIDTGGDLLTLPPDFGVEPLATFGAGAYAGGVEAEGGYGRVGSVRLGRITVRDVPVAIARFPRPVIGTGFLSRFLPTIDHPGRRLVLRPRDAAPPAGVEVPFAVAATHLIVTRGALAGHELTLLVDSGLRDEHGAAFTAPAATLAAAGIPLPATAPETGESGAGPTTLEVGRFTVPRLAVGAVEQRDLVGIYGVFPPQLSAAAGFPIHGLVSHGFLRRYRWTLDFTRMRMVFEGRTSAG